MRATPVGVDRPLEGHAARAGHVVEDRAGSDVQELEASVLARADVAVDEVFVGEEGRLAGLVLLLDELPPPVWSLANICS
jgi:hypothetical protein